MVAYITKERDREGGRGREIEKKREEKIKERREKERKMKR